VLHPPVRRNIKLAEAPSFGQTIFDYAPRCPGADDYRRIVQSLLERWGLPHGEFEGAPRARASTGDADDSPARPRAGVSTRKSARASSAGRSGKKSRSSASSKSRRDEMPEKPVRAPKRAKAAKVSKSARAAKPAKSAKAAKSAKVSKPAKASKPSKPARSAKPARPAKRSGRIRSGGLSL
jgi:hypothetical protein